MHKIKINYLIGDDQGPIVRVKTIPFIAEQVILGGIYEGIYRVTDRTFHHDADTEECVTINLEKIED